jgi:Flp pilus assembly protein TadD
MSAHKSRRKKSGKQVSGREQCLRIVDYACELRRAGRTSDALNALDRAAQLDPAAPSVYRWRARLLADRQDMAGAMDAFSTAVRLAGDDAVMLIELGADLVQAGNMPAALDTYQQAAQLAPGDANARSGLVRTLIAVGRSTEALTQCEAFFEQHQPDTIMLTSTVAAHYAAGNGAGARQLMDFDALVEWYPLTDFGPWQDMGRFNAALIEHLSSHATLSRDPGDKTTRGGFQTGELLDDSPGPVGLLAEFVRKSVGNYVGRINALGGNTFSAQPFRTQSVSAWGVLLDGDGQQLPHYHPAAWISAVYYAQVPPTVNAPDNGGAGWIQFGPPMEQGVDDPALAFRGYQPQLGKLVIFPAFFFHGTIPTGSPEQRACVAFDVS